MPSDPRARSRVICWLFAALNSIEPPIQTLAGIDLFHPEEAWPSSGAPRLKPQ